MIRFLTLLLAVSLNVQVHAQQSPLPTVQDEAAWETLESAACAPQAEIPVDPYKKGFFQKLQYKGGWVGSFDADELGMSHLEMSASFAIPLGSRENIVLATPFFRVDYLDGPLTPDVPARLYDTGIKFFGKKDFHERWTFVGMASPTYRSDFEASEKAMRVFLAGFAVWHWIPDELDLYLGAVYLDRADFDVLPAVGAKWTPNPQWTVDLMFPRPRVGHRLDKNGRCSETWAYVAGGLGGNTWAVRRDNGLDDELSIRDYRLILGVEKIKNGGAGWFLEAGYAFDRRLEYESSPIWFEYNDALMLEAGIRY